MEIGSSGGVCTCSDDKRFGAVEMRCSRRDIGGMEICSGGTLQACRRRDVDVWSSSVLFVVVGISSFRSSRRLGKTLAPPVKVKP